MVKFKVNAIDTKFKDDVTKVRKLYAGDSFDEALSTFESWTLPTGWTIALCTFVDGQPRVLRQDTIDYPK